jgi:transmembrane E3 ubiquitin-protein ligase
MRKEKHAVCKHFYALYLINIFFLYYVKGCPACLLRYPLDLPLCFTATLLAALIGGVLYLQGRYGPLLCLRECILGKDYRYKLEISLSEGEEMMEEVCAICLQPLATEALVENFRESAEGRRGTIMRTPCNHKYHGECLRTWLQEKNTCPLDNQTIPPCFE